MPAKKPRRHQRITGESSTFVHKDFRNKRICGAIGIPFADVAMDWCRGRATWKSSGASKPNFSALLNQRVDATHVITFDET